MYITRGQLSTVVDSYQQPLNEHRLFSADHPDASVFLSHKHEEKTLLLQVKKFFENLGMSVYVDWLDTRMQHPTDKKTAEDLKRQIDENDKFIFIATDGAMDSPWCSWEIGLGDALKLKDDKIAIFPVAENDGTWEKHEYLQIYPHIEYEDGTNHYSDGGIITKGYYIKYPYVNGKRNSVKLEKWLCQGMPTTRFL